MMLKVIHIEWYMVIHKDKDFDYAKTWSIFWLRAHTLVRFRAPSGARGWFVWGCFGGKIYSFLFHVLASGTATVEENSKR